MNQGGCHFLTEVQKSPALTKPKQSACWARCTNKRLELIGRFQLQPELIAKFEKD